MIEPGTEVYGHAAEVSSTLSDDVVVERIRAGNAAAYEIIMRRYNQRLYRVARSILRDADDAQDAVQEAYVRAYFKLGSYAPGGAFGAWLTRIAINEALMIKRKNGKMEHDDLDVDRLVATDVGPAEQNANRELAGLIERAVDRLPGDFRTVFVLRAMQQLSVHETAICLDIPQATVKTRFHRARNLLQQMLNAQIDGAGLRAFEFDGERCDRIVQIVFGRLGVKPAEQKSDRQGGSPA